jgi:hypothetical protein
MRYRYTVIVLGIGIVLLLGKYNYNNTIQANNENIIKIENEKLYEDLVESHIEILKYKNILESFKNIDENKSVDYVYYNIPNLTIKNQEYIQNLCDANNISYTLVLGIIRAESNFQNEIISSSDDWGIMQIHKPYAKSWANGIGMNTYDLLRFEDNVKLGITILVFCREYLKSQGITADEDLAEMILGCYNLGITGFINRYESTGKISTNYSDLVLNYKMKLETNQELN